MLLETGQEQNLRLFDGAYFALVAARHPHGDRLRALQRRVVRPIDWPISARILVLACLVAVLALVLVTRYPLQWLFPSGGPGGARLASSAANLQEWMVTVEKAGKNSIALLVTGVRTRRSYPLLPINAALPSDGEAFLDPQYLPSLHAIGYIHVWHQVRSLWLASLSFQGGEPQLVPGGLHELVDNCTPCNTFWLSARNPM